MTNREKKEVVIFGGTKEGRELAEYCIAAKLPAAVSVASYYGKDLLPENLQLEIQEGPMDKETMSKWLAEKEPDFVLDATHPYAVHVTENIKVCCSRLSLGKRCERRGPDCRRLKGKCAGDYRKQGTGSLFGCYRF